MKKQKFGSCLPPFATCSDRYCQSGYSEQKSFEDILRRASTVKDLSGVELLHGDQVNENNFNEISTLLKRYGLEVCLIVPDLWTKAKWGKGSFASKERKVREEAVLEVKQSMDVAAAFNCDKVDVWLGQDGFDYSFQSNYLDDWDNIVECTSECAKHRSDVKICIEYKLKEPRTHCFINSAAKALLLVNEINKDNVGVMIDVGHSIAALENPSEACGRQRNYRSLSVPSELIHGLLILPCWILKEIC